MSTAPLLGLPAASLQSSLDAFLDALEAFFSDLAAVRWELLFLALLLYLGNLSLRSRAWFNSLRAAYPAEQFQWRRILGSYIAGVGVNAVVPVRGGDVVKLYLAKHSIPGSRYPTIASSLLAEWPFDFAIGMLVLLFALTQGVLPSLPELPDLPAFDLSFWAENPKFALFTITALTIGLLATYAVLSVRAVVFWRRVRQGLVIVSDRPRFMRQVVALQACGWTMRLASFWFFLEAFNIGGSLENALLVMSVQALSTLTPFTPGGAGAQQALLVFVFRDVASKSAVLAYSVGQQIAIAAFSAAAAAVALGLMIGTTNFRRAVRLGREDKERAETSVAASAADGADTPEAPAPVRD